VLLGATASFPASLYDGLLGLNRRVFRVVASLALMPDDYPPLRLDTGGLEASRVPGAEASSAPGPFGP
jgi:hypothetical protein